MLPPVGAFAGISRAFQEDSVKVGSGLPSNQDIYIYIILLMYTVLLYYDV